MRWITPTALALLFVLPALAEDPPAANPVDDFFTRWDANKDGIVTTDECNSTRLFGKNDTDTDGKITRAEVEAVWKEEEGTETLTEPKTTGPAAERGKPGKGGATLPEARGGKERPMSGGSGMNDEQNKMRVRRIFNRFDKNGDDQLDGVESGAYWFEVLDVDRDGALMESELAANPKVGADKAAMAMQYYDKDADGAIFAAEWSLPEDGAFRRVDANSDGKISFDEALLGLVPAKQGGDSVALTEGRAPVNPDEYIKTNDADGDGKISATEFKGPKGLFGKADANADGFVDRAELEDASKKMAKMGGGGMPGGGKPGKGGDLASMIKRADKDGDGKVTREEWPGRPQGFDRMDKNADGVLDEADFGEAPPMSGGDNQPPGNTEPGMSGEPTDPPPMK